MAEVKTILLVDDDRELVDVMRTMFEGQGYRVLLAHDGIQAKHMVYNHKPDLMILDLMMNRLGGFPVLEHFRDKADAPPIIMMTANEGGRHKAYAEHLGAVEFIRKPFSIERILESARKALGTQQGSQADAPPHDVPADSGPEKAESLSIAPYEPSQISSVAEQVGHTCHSLKGQLSLLRLMLSMDPLNYQRMIIELEGVLEKINDLYRQIRSVQSPDKLVTLAIQDRLPTAIQEMVGMFCHEIKNPLSSLALRLQLERINSAAHSSVEEAGHIIDDLHQLVRNYYRNDSDPIAVIKGTEIADYLGTLLHANREASHNLSIVCDGLDELTQVPRVLLRLFIVPLFDNSIECLHSKVGKIVVTVGKSLNPYDLRIEVRDNGDGWPGGAIEAKRRIHQYESFSTKGPGRGRGLINLKLLVEKLSGRLELEDAPTGGAISRIDIKL